MNRPHREKLLKESLGFLTSPEDEQKLLAEDRLQQVLVRCGGGRFTCAVQDLAHFVEIINKDGTDYVRDVCVIRGQ
jgi:hypothetical protein